MKRLIHTLALLIALWQALPALAVTDKEMEQARVIATQTYLRYANDGSGYLDALHPSTMAELERNLKTKEKENIKAFKAIPVPTDYASWDKQKLINYWTDTAFANSALLPKGKVGKNPTRKKLSAMKIAEPSPNETKAAQPAAETKPAAAPAATKPAQEQPKPSTAAPAEQTQTDLIPVPIDSAAAEEEARAAAEAALDEDPMIQKESTHTWVYVVILCILVAIVVALVVFASNVMKKNVPANPQWQGPNSDEVKSLNRKLQEANSRVEEAERQNKILQRKVDALTAELNKLRPRTPQTQQPPIKGIPYPKQTSVTGSTTATPMPSQAAPQPIQPKAQQPAAQAPAATSAQQATHTAQQTPAAQAPRQPVLRTIYLGVVNDKGIFIRADRSFNTGNSVYRLDTSDGMAGTFKVISDPSILEKVIEHPIEMLGFGCAGTDLTNTVGLQEIVTDSAGTAIFDNGRWKVMRKAKIHFE